MKLKVYEIKSVSVNHSSILVWQDLGYFLLLTKMKESPVWISKWWCKLEILAPCIYEFTAHLKSKWFFTHISTCVLDQRFYSWTRSVRKCLKWEKETQTHSFSGHQFLQCDVWRSAILLILFHQSEEHGGPIEEFSWSAVSDNAAHIKLW